MAKSPPFNAAASFNELFKAPQGERAAVGLKLIDLSHIHVMGQPRQSFPATEQADLVASIRELRSRGEGIEGTGILQPLVVTPVASGYRLIAGERRLRAAGDAKLTDIPAIVIQTQEENIGLLQIIENLQRQNLRPLEEAQAIQSLMEMQNLSLRTAAALLGKKKGYVENRLNLLKMGSDLQELVSVRTDTLQHARLIEPIDNKSLRKKLIQNTHDGASERELRLLIQNAENVDKNRKSAPSQKQPLSVRTDSDNGSSTELASSANSNFNPIMHAIRPGVAQMEEGIAALESAPSTPQKQRARLLRTEIKRIEVLLDRMKTLAAK